MKVIGKFLAVIGGIFILLIVIAALTGGSSNSPQKVENSGQNEDISQNSEKEKKVYGVGDTVSYNNVKITLKKVETSTGGQYSTLENDEKYVSLKLNVKNDSDQQMVISSIGSMNLLDSQKNTYDATFMNQDRTEIDGDVAAGAQKSGWVSFAVPQKETEFEFRYQHNSFIKDSTIKYKFQTN